MDSTPVGGGVGQLTDARALVTGASGFLGSRLCRRLVAEGVEVHAVSRTRRDDGRVDGLRWWQCDAVDATAVHDLMGRIKPDVVFHFGGLVTAAAPLRLVMPTFHSLVTTTVNVLAAATELGGSRVVLSASLEEPTGGDVATLVPTSPYSAAKFAAGAYARMFGQLYGTSVVTLRPYMTYGPGQHPSKVVPYTILSLLRGERPQLRSGDRGVDWIYVDDVIEGFVRAAWRPGIEGQTLDLGCGTAVPIRSMAERLVRMIAPGLTPMYGTPADGGEGPVRIADLGATVTALGWRPTTPLEDGLAATVEWYRHGDMGAGRADR